MRVTLIWEKKGKPTISFEFFPARSEKGASKLGKTIKALADLKPDFVAVTLGAGGHAACESPEPQKRPSLYSISVGATRGKNFDLCESIGEADRPPLRK
jgi:5,10-methylenetetrahydrofolate reductase